MKTVTIKTKTINTVESFRALSIVDKWELWLLTSIALLIFLPIVGIILEDKHFLETNAYAKASALIIALNLVVCLFYRFIKGF